MQLESSRRRKSLKKSLFLKIVKNKKFDMYLKKIKKLAANQNLVIVGDKTTKLAKTISDSAASFFKDFVKG